MMERVQHQELAILQATFLKSLNNIDEKVMPLDEKHLVYSGDETRTYSSGVKARNFRAMSKIMIGASTQIDQTP